MRTRIITLLMVLALTTLSVFAQGEHLKFKGIPIDGTLKEFTSKLKAKGFEKTTEGNNYIAFQGSFAGYNDCSIIVYSLDKIDLVHTVAVMFPDYDSWSLLEGNYKNIKSMLTKKYGNPVMCEEGFHRDNIRDDNSKMYEFKMNRCDYSSTFVTDSGMIILKLCHEFNKCYVLLGYADGINNVLKEATAIDDL